MIEKGLNQHCFLPGTERYTRPEEVKALSKFLKHVKEVQDEHTKLEEDNLMLPGSKDIRPRLPGVSGLEDRRIDINGNENRVDLENYREELGGKKNPELETSRLGTPENKGGSRESLETGRESLEDTRDISLETARESLEDTRDIPLETGRESLEGNKEVPLETGRESLEVPEGVDSLPADRETLETSSDISLEDTRETLETPDTPELSQNLETINPGITPDLGKYRESLQGKDDPELETGLELLEGTLGETPLSEKREELSDQRETALEEGSEKLGGTQKNYILPEGSETLNLPKEDPTLETDLEKLLDPRSIDLPRDLETLRRPEDPELEGGREILRGPGETPLEDSFETLNSPEDPELSAEKETLIAGREVDLETGAEKLSVSGDIELPDLKETLKDPNEPSLSNYREDIKGPGEQPLSDYRESLDDSREQPLSDYQEPLQDSREQPLSDYRESLGDSREPFLDDTQLKTPDNQGGERESLEDTRIDLDGPEELPLDDTRLDLKEPETPPLDDTKIKAPENKGGTKESLEDYLGKLEEGEWKFDPETDNLPDFRDPTPDNDESREFREYENVWGDPYREDLKEDWKFNPETDSLPDYREDTPENDKSREFKDYEETWKDPQKEKLEEGEWKFDPEEDSLPDFKDLTPDNDESREFKDYEEVWKDPKKEKLEEGEWGFNPDEDSLPDYREDTPDNDTSREFKDYEETWKDPKKEELEEGEWKFNPEEDSLPDSLEELLENDFGRDGYKDYEEVWKDPKKEKLEEGEWGFDPETDSLPNEVDREPGIENDTTDRTFIDPDRRREEDYPWIYATPKNAEILGDGEGSRARDYKEPDWEKYEDLLEYQKKEKMTRRKDEAGKEIMNSEAYLLQDTQESPIEDFVPGTQDLENYQREGMGRKKDGTGREIIGSESTLLQNETVDRLYEDPDRKREEDYRWIYATPRDVELLGDEESGFRVRNKAEIPGSTYEDLEEFQKRRMDKKTHPETGLPIEDSESWLLKNKTEVGQGRNSRDRGYVDVGLLSDEDESWDIRKYQLEKMRGTKDATGKITPDSESFILQNKTLGRDYIDLDKFENRKELDKYQIEKTQGTLPKNETTERDYKNTEDFKTGSDLEGYQRRKVRERKRDSVGREILRSESTLPANEVVGRRTKNSISEASRLVNKEDPEVGIPSYNLSGVRGPAMLDVSKYLRWTAENTVGKIKTNATRKKVLIDETLAALVAARDLLEKATKANRERLPGDDLGAISDLIQNGFDLKKTATNVISTFGNAVKDSLLNKNADHTNPNNRPKPDASFGDQLLSKTQLAGLVGNLGTIRQKKWTAPGQTVMDYTGEDPKSKSGGGLLGKLGSAVVSGASKALNSLTGGLLGGDGALPSETRNIGDMVIGYYGNGESVTREDEKNGTPSKAIGMGVTISDLFRKNSEEDSLESLNQAIKDSLFLTTPNKFTSTSEGPRYMTLDSNHIWEIIFRPYVGLSNGFSTWLPSFYELDKINKTAFNMTTRFAYGWLPITGFELMSRKMASKDLTLFDGSISFPVGLEFTNELRITFADDSLKSLRRYFDLCANVSSFMSNIHIASSAGQVGSTVTNAEMSYMDFVRDYSKGEFEESFNPTVFLDGKIHPGNYKNLSFLVSVYILTPQLATIKKTDLLCVMKDYTIENQGEVDSSPTDLTVSFSIVGENPRDSAQMVIDKMPESSTSKSSGLLKTIANVAGNLGSLASTVTKLI